MSALDLETAWPSVMDENPLRNSAHATAHMIMQMLAWMWSAVFSISIGSYFVFGITSMAHILLIGALFVTLIMFQQAER